MAAALSPYQDEEGGGYRHIETAKRKTRRKEKAGGGGRTAGEGKGSRGSDVTTEIKSNANTKLHYPSHTLANPLSFLAPFVLYLSRFAPRFLSIFRFAFSSPFLCLLSLSSFRSLPTYDATIPFVGPPPPSPHHHHHHLLPPPHLTYPWGITPLPFVLYGAGTANRRATESVACYTRA